MNGGDLTQQQQQKLQPLAMQQQQQQQVQYQQQQGGKASHYPSGSSEDNKTVKIGDIQEWMDEEYLRSCFAKSSEPVSVKIKIIYERYGVVEFGTHEAAEKVLQGYNNTVMPHSDQTFSLNWADSSNIGDRRSEPGDDMFGDLAPDVTDALLLE